MRTFITALSAIALGAASTAAMGEDMVIKYDDLDLASPKGQKTLDRRIDAAARSFCGVGEMHTGSRLRPNTKECFDSARSAAREQLKHVLERHTAASN